MNKNSIFNTLLIDSMFQNEIIDNNNIKKCLISDNPLDENHITLKCNHSFNYNYILQEVKSNKKKGTRYNSTYVKKWSIQCPYCRNIQNGILPYRDTYEKIKYVNWPPKQCFIKYECMHIFKRGKNKGKKCGKISCDKYCKLHSKQYIKVKSTEISTQTPIKDQKQIYALCEHILTRGSNKGNVCNKKVILHKFKKNDSIDNINLNDYKYKKYYCKCHQKKYGELEVIGN